MAAPLAVLALASLLVAKVAGSASPATEPPPGDDLRFAVHVLTWAPDAETGLAPPEASAAFQLNPNLWASSAMPVRVHFNPAGAPESLPVEELITSAIAQWTDVETSSFVYEYAGTTEADAGTCDFASRRLDGKNTIAFSTSLSTGILGVTCTVWRGGANGNLVEFDIRMNANMNWGRSGSLGPGQFDLASTILHELGHGAGLGHPCERTATCTEAEQQAVMYPRLRAREERNVLMPDDIAGISAAYPETGQQGGFTPTVRILIPTVAQD
jgi:hypothetical protein